MTLFPRCKKSNIINQVFSCTFQMYVELYGDDTQEQNEMPSRVHLNVTHLSSSYFRDGTGKVREFRQPPASSRKFEFNRFAVTNTAKCNEETKKGNSK